MSEGDIVRPNSQPASVLGAAPGGYLKHADLAAMDPISRIGAPVLSSSFALAGRRLEMHQRLVSLAAIREGLCQQVRVVEEQKVQLAEQKAAEQQRLIHGLKLRLEVAQGSLDEHLGDLHSRCQVVERQMSTYGRMLRGTEGEPCESRWQELEAQFQRLQMQQVMMMDPGSFQRLLDTLRGSSTGYSSAKAVEDLRSEVLMLRNAQVDQEKRMEALRHGKKEAEARVETLTEELEQAKAVNGDLLRKSISVEVAAVREQYEKALVLMEKEHSGVVQKLKAETQELKGNRKGSSGVSDEAADFTRTSKDHGKERQGPLSMLREALGGSRGSAADNASKSHGPDDNGTPGSQEIGRDNIHKLLLEVQARAVEERRRMDMQHRAELQQQASAHEETIRELVASQEQAMARLTSLLHNNPSHMAQREAEAAVQEKLEGVQESLENAKQKMERMKEEFEARLGYELYKERVAQEKRLAEVRDEATMQAASRVLDAQAEVEALKKQLAEAHGPEGAASRQELEQDLAKANERSDSAVKQAVEAERRRMQQAHQTAMAGLQLEHDAALAEREAELESVLSELRALREQHFASSSSGCDVNSLAFKPQEAQGDDPQSPSLAGMGSSSLFTLSPPSTAAGVRNARQPFRRRSDVEAAEPPVPDSAESPAESTASVPQRSSAWENRSSGAAAGAELPSLRPTSVAAPGMAMSTLVAGILGRLSSGVRQTAPEGTERQLQGGTGGQADDVRRGRGAGEWSARVPAGGAMSFSGAAPVDAAGKGESRCTTEESPRCIRCGLNDASSPGVCRFHPFLVKAPGPFLYGPEWHLCKANRHLPEEPGCYKRSEHYYSGGIIASLLAGGGTSNSVRQRDSSGKGETSPPPVPRQLAPQPTPSTSPARR